MSLPFPDHPLKSLGDGLEDLNHEAFRSRRAIAEVIASKQKSSEFIRDVLAHFCKAPVMIEARARADPGCGTWQKCSLMSASSHCLSRVARKGLRSATGTTRAIGFPSQEGVLTLGYRLLAEIYASPCIGYTEPNRVSRRTAGWLVKTMTRSTTYFRKSITKFSSKLSSLILR